MKNWTLKVWIKYRFRWNIIFWVFIICFLLLMALFGCSSKRIFIGNIKPESEIKIKFEPPARLEIEIPKNYYWGFSYDFLFKPTVTIKSSRKSDTLVILSSEPVGIRIGDK